MRSSILLILVLFFEFNQNAAWSQNMDLRPDIVKFFNGLNKETMDTVNQFYADNCVFEDPLGQINGVKDMRRYYENLYQNVEAIQFEFTSQIQQNNQYAMAWTMSLTAKGLNGGKEIKVPGLSLIKFDESTRKAAYHRDYFDMGAFIYDHIPVLKNILGFIKSKLKH